MQTMTKLSKCLIDKEAHHGDTMVSVPDHHSEVNISIKWVT